MKSKRLITTAIMTIILGLSLNTASFARSLTDDEMKRATAAEDQLSDAPGNGLIPPLEIQELEEKLQELQTETERVEAKLDILRRQFYEQYRHDFRIE